MIVGCTGAFRGNHWRTKRICWFAGFAKLVALIWLFDAAQYFAGNAIRIFGHFNMADVKLCFRIIFSVVFFNHITAVWNFANTAPFSRANFKNFLYYRNCSWVSVFF